jgi:hypothetical protein
MAVRARNLDPSVGNDAFLSILVCPITVGASVDQRVAEVRLPWAGKIVSAHFRCSTLTDADDSVRVKVQKNGTDLVAAAVDPVASDTTTTFTLTADTFAAGDLLQGHVLTGTGDAIVGTFTFFVRPYLGVRERSAQGLAG